MLVGATTITAGAVGQSAPKPNEVVITYLRGAPSRTAAPVIATPPDEGIAGARLGLADDLATGRFLGESFRMNEVTVADENTLAEQSQVAALMVADIAPPLLLRIADLPATRGSTILDIATPDDQLREATCRANVLHLVPSRAMLADALMQYLVTKDWRRISLLTGRDPADKSYADSVRRSAKKFRVTIVADREWSFNPAAQQADTGHFQINTEVAEATRGDDYDVLVVADEAGNFGDSLAYRTSRPRPVAGTQGLIATAWSPVFDEYAATQLQNRFHRQAGRPMTQRDYAGWLALRAIGEAATRSGKTDPAAIAATMRSDDFALAGYKGAPLSFRAWDGQLRQPVLLTDDRSLVSIAPLPGFLHQFSELDTLGVDRPESKCRF